MKILMFSTHSMKYIWYSPQKRKYPLFIREVINVNTDYFLLLMVCLCCTSKRSVQENLMVEIKTLRTEVVFP